MTDRSSDPADTRASRADPAFLAIVAAYVAWAAGFIWRTSFVIGGTRWFSLFDDAMISMRYARSLARGDGLVWNPGERVEGITNPLWTLWMTLPHLLGVPEAKISLWIQLTSLALMVALLFVVRALALRVSAGSRPVALASAALCAAYLPLSNWSLQGMEVGVMALLVTLAVLDALRSVEIGRMPVLCYALLATSTFVRPDGVVPLLAVAGLLFLLDRPRRWRHAAVGAALFLACAGVQTAARLAYYGAPLPNTYYLKMTGYPVGLRITRGVWALAAMVIYGNPLLFLLPLLLLVREKYRRLDILLPLGVTAALVAYSVYVGGDAWESWGGANRYISVAIPLFFVLLALALHAAVARLAGGRRMAGPLFVAMVVYAAVQLNALKGTRTLREWVLLDRPMAVNANERLVRMGLAIREHSRPETRVAVRWGGALPYFADRPGIDMLGKADAAIAHLRMHGPPPAGFERLVGFWPGHLKYDYDYSILRLRPDVVANLDWDEALLRRLRGYDPVDVPGGTIYVRRGSTAWTAPRTAPAAAAGDAR